MLIALADDFPLLDEQPYLVLVAKKPIATGMAELIRKTIRALQAASAAVTTRPGETASEIQKQFFAEASPDAIAAAVRAMASGVAGGGRLDAKSVGNALIFAEEVGTPYGKGVDARVSEGDLWTNHFVETAGAR